MDPYNNVYTGEQAQPGMGQMGTGAAFILPDSGGPSPAQIIYANRQQQMAKNLKDAQDRQNAYNDVYNNLPTAWARDYPALQGMQNDLLKTTQRIQARKGNLNDPNDPDYYKFHNQLNDLKQTFQNSREQQAQATVMEKDIAANPNKYTPEFIQKFNEWKDVNHPKRGNMPEPEEKDNFNPGKFEQEMIKSNPPTEEGPLKSYFDNVGQIVNTQTLQHSPVAAMGILQQHRAIEPKYDAYYAHMMKTATDKGTYSPVQQLKDIKDLQAINKKNGTNFDLQDMYMLKHIPQLTQPHQKVNAVQQTKNTTNINMGGGAGDSDNQAAEDFVNRQQLLHNGDPSIVQQQADPNFIEQRANQITTGTTNPYSSNSFIGLPAGDRYVDEAGNPAKANTKNAKKAPDLITAITRDPNGQIDVSLESGNHIKYNGLNSGYDQFTKRILANGDYSQKVKNLIDLKLRQKGIINKRNGKQDWTVNYTPTTGNNVNQTTGKEKANW
jgi:hypothetical protein